ncbi:hypothetical protein RHOFW510R12_11205 [Rhodanobacter sp. FW510-R12]|uniref:toll/interleukin-1 receptor domain-containing protein n=2 Tax=Rhodanobacter TaxID=75309 RepID=UPI0007A9AC3B|nr:hypothetical protein RHOFW104R8_08775 [Rhodanobacter sp. FW104-R8]KZC26067.1 hypothetical protein RhoFW510T8_04185 [Rhodanobacter sp. FW510-T8]KZC29530.1 hypothetical protein RhoFW510R10_05475 [Rhodanobacter sp. FW510-R10]
MTQASVMPAFRYRAFISHSHQDKSRAGWLHKPLEACAIPKRPVGQTTTAGVIPGRLAPIFRDRDELASATDLGRKVDGGLAQSANLIVICSPRSATSPWVNAEVLAFKRMGHADRIFFLVVDGEPDASDLPGRAAEERFAPALSFRLDADGQPTTGRTEPIAADARAGTGNHAVRAGARVGAGNLERDGGKSPLPSSPHSAASSADAGTKARLGFNPFPGQVTRPCTPRKASAPGSDSLRYTRVGAPGRPCGIRPHEPRGHV